MEFEFKATAVIRLRHNGEKKGSELLHSKFYFEPSDNLPNEVYVDAEGIPTHEAIKPLTQCFIQGLLGNIHTAHLSGRWDSAEHLRYIIAELERGFIENPSIKKVPRNSESE